MDAVVYVSKPLKKINGTLFYCFEYYTFLKQYIPDLKFIFVWGFSPLNLWKNGPELDYFKEVFKDKYNFDHTILNDIVAMTPIEYMKSHVTNAAMFDVHSYKMVQDFLGRTKNVLLYCNKPDGKLYFGKRPERDTFYGWYDGYQFYNVKTRLKIYKEMHKVSNTRGTKAFISSPNGDNLAIAKELNMKLDDVYFKEANKHYNNLFEQIGKIVYWHTGSNDANNRMIVEACIHNMPIEIYTNGHEGDSVYDRKTLIEQGRVSEFFLTEDDAMVKDFIAVCKQER